MAQAMAKVIMDKEQNDVARRAAQIVLGAEYPHIHAADCNIGANVQRVLFSRMDLGEHFLAEVPFFSLRRFLLCAFWLYLPSPSRGHRPGTLVSICLLSTGSP